MALSSRLLVVLAQAWIFPTLLVLARRSLSLHFAVLILIFQCRYHVAAAIGTVFLEPYMLFFSFSILHSVL